MATVDSGRLAEPYWYADSPLTTPEPSRPFAGRPPKGEDAVPAPGVIVPDAPVEVPGRPGVHRLREIARDGLTVLLAGGDHERLTTAARAATDAPVTVLGLERIDRSGVLAAALRPAPGEAWLIRPDAHIAAVLPGADPATLTAAVRRSVGLVSDRPSRA
jgi:pentachlorophenol monooxygenase/3-(3-hydroxy-phenyl)propionate hydroxylase